MYSVQRGHSDIVSVIKHVTSIMKFNDVMYSVQRGHSDIVSVIKHVTL
jgi:hypothetical protein